MKKSGLIFRSYGDPMVVLEHFESTREHLLEGQLEVRMIATPINPSDLIPIWGAYSHRVKPPCVPGYEGVGIVVRAGPGCQGRIGERVIPIGGNGIWQTHVVVDAHRAITVPDDLSDNLAARSYINPLAALLLLQENPVEGRTVILTAGNSTCARILAQWAKFAGADRILAVTDTVVENAFFAETGVSNVATQDLKIDPDADMVVFDAVGGCVGDRIISELGRSSRFISYGLLSGVPMRSSVVDVGPKRFHLRDWVNPASSIKLKFWFNQIFSCLRETVVPDTADYHVKDWAKALKHFQMRGRTRKPILTFER